MKVKVEALKRARKAFWRYKGIECRHPSSARAGGRSPTQPAPQPSHPSKSLLKAHWVANGWLVMRARSRDLLLSWRDAPSSCARPGQREDLRKRDTIPRTIVSQEPAAERSTSEQSKAKLNHALQRRQDADEENMGRRLTTRKSNVPTHGK
jgi:hypothetical protein